MACLAPFLPKLLGLGQQAAAVATEAGKAAWQRSQALWEQLRPKLAAKPAAQEAATDAAQHPDDANYQAAFKVQLKKILAEDEALAQAIADLLAGTESEGAGDRLEVHTSGDQSPAIGKISGGASATIRYS